MNFSHYSAALCPDPVDIDNSTVTFTGNSIGDTTTYNCDSGFELIGDAITTCTQMNATFAVFSPQPPFCSREYWLESLHIFFMLTNLIRFHIGIIVMNFELLCSTVF